MEIKHIRIAIFTAVIAFMISCSQKYDSSGIFDPQDPNFYADTSSVILNNDTVLYAKKSINDGYIYIGRDIVAGDTTAWAESVFKVNLPLATDSLDSAFIVYKINSCDPLIIGKRIDVFKTEAVWADSTAEQTDFDLPSVPFTSCDITLVDSSLYRIRIPIDSLSLTQWAADDTISTQTESFYLKDAAGNNISPVMKMYSSKWAYTSLRPKIYSYYSYPDTLTATDGGDSVITVSEVDSAYISDDISLVEKKHSFLDLVQDEIKLGGISGESYACRIDLSGIDTSAVVITGRIDLTAVTDEIDAVYGSISNNVSTSKEVSVYIMTDSLWYSDEEIYNYDKLNPWDYKINLSDSANYLVMDAVIQNWIKNPDNNFGFLITTKNWGSPFGFSVFKKPKINVSYIIVGE
ncbi:TPA: hypothetical protein DCR49_03770 [Candidatus Delongbacteria bacterium]|nr:hypothetical protein [Candidatus Delongbacteria bacterium]